MDVSHSGPDGRLKIRHIREPSLLFYPRPMEHVFHNAPSEDSDFACATVEFEAGENHPLVRSLPAVTVLPLGDVPSLGPALDLLFAELDEVRCGRRLLADRMFEVVLIQLYRWILDHPAELSMPNGVLVGLGDENLAPVLAAIHQAPGEPWNLSTMAREAHMARSTFAAKFKELLGQTPADYLAEWRFTVAKEQLKLGTPVAIAAANLGYSSPSAFSRAFTQRAGRSPRAWLISQKLEALPA